MICQSKLRKGISCSRVLTQARVLCVQRMYQTNLLVAGWDEKAGPSLFWLDYLATMHSMNVAGTGYGAPLTPLQYL